MNSLKHDVINNKIAAEHGESINYSRVAAFSEYATEHIANHKYADVHNHEILWAAVGRLEWLLMYGRSDLNGLFTEADVKALLDCYQGDVFSPFELKSFAGSLCKHLNFAPESALNSEHGELLSTLLRLTPLQRLSLADVLEQTWHRGITYGQTVSEFFKSLGIDLR